MTDQWVRASRPDPVIKANYIMPKRLQKSHLPITAQPVHITYRLAGSIPRSEIKKVEEARDIKLAAFERELENVHDNQLRAKLTQKRNDIYTRSDLELDRLLHTIKSGPRHLAKREIWKLVARSWHDLHIMQRVFVIAFCIMSNHVHVILKAPANKDSVDSGKLMESHKGYTSRQANELLGTTGVPFWDSNYNDSTVRQGRFYTALWYVVNNPLQAGLVEHWRDWPATYVHPDYLAHLLPEE